MTTEYQHTGTALSALRKFGDHERSCDTRALAGVHPYDGGSGRCTCDWRYLDGSTVADKLTAEHKERA